MISQLAESMTLTRSASSGKEGNSYKIQNPPHNGAKPRYACSWHGPQTINGQIPLTYEPLPAIA